MGDGKMRLGISMRGLGYHPAAWKHPEVPADGTLRIEHYVRTAQAAERGKLDMVFFADGIAIRTRDVPKGSRAHSGHEVCEMEPMTLLPALAMVTSNIGLVTTASTTYNEPYHVARKFGTLDLISNGRSGWNVVTSWSPAEAANFGLDAHPDYATRYDRAAEFLEVVNKLWDSWEPEAFILDKESGVFFDENKLHAIEHKGKYFSVRGPLNVGRLPQGRPVIVQAGASDQGRDIAAETAEVVYAMSSSIEQAQAFYADVKGRMTKFGRQPDELKILPAIRPIVGRTEAEAREKYDELQALLDPVVGLASIASTFGDLSGYPLDGPVPVDALGPRELKSLSDQLAERIRTEKPTIRQLYQQVAGGGSNCVVGTPEQVADRMQAWFENGACDGFNITPSILPLGCEDFVDLVVPELQSRGLFRTEYEGGTLRENLGLRAPVNSYTQKRQSDAA